MKTNKLIENIFFSNKTIKSEQC